MCIPFQLLLNQTKKYSAWRSRIESANNITLCFCCLICNLPDICVVLARATGAPVYMLYVWGGFSVIARHFYVICFWLLYDLHSRGCISCACFFFVFIPESGHSYEAALTMCCCCCFIIVMVFLFFLVLVTFSFGYHRIWPRTDFS